MRKTKIFVFVFVVAILLTFAPALFAEGQAAAGTVENQKPVSTDDLKKQLDEAMQKMQDTIREADKKSSEQSAASQIALEGALQDQKSEVENLRREISARDAEQARIQRETDEQRQEETKKGMIRIGIIAAIVLVFVLVGIGFIFRKLENNTQQKVFAAATASTSKKVEATAKPLKNPKDARMVWKFIEENPNLQATLEHEGKLEIETGIVMPVKNTPFDNRKADCSILVTKGSRHLQLRFKEETEIIAWNNRFEHMAKVTLPNMDCKNVETLSQK